MELGNGGVDGILLISGPRGARVLVVEEITVVLRLVLISWRIFITSVGNSRRLGTNSTMITTIVTIKTVTAMALTVK
jgi:hypothetical protein